MRTKYRVWRGECRGARGCGGDLVARRAFTIIEIAICLGIIGFALVAIIAVLPRGLDVQKRNREETIVGQDAEVWMNAIRSGAKGYDDLTNYVECITNFWTEYNANFQVVSPPNSYDYYTYSNSKIVSFSPAPNFLLTNGAHIIGLLGMPKLTTVPAPNTAPMALPDYADPPFRSNYVVAVVRAISGSAVTKAPQSNPTILSDAFRYRLIVENFPYVPVDTNAFTLTGPVTNNLTTAQLAARTNLMQTMWLLETNSHDFRLRFRWPVLPNGQIGSYGYATFRCMVDGWLLQTNDPAPGAGTQPLYFIQPSLYVQQTGTPP